METKKKVSMTWQIVLMTIGLIIPLVWLYPFYKVQKLGYGILINVLGYLSFFVPLLLWDYDGMSDEMTMIFSTGIMVIWIVKIPILFYFLIKWSRAWNKKCEVE